MATRYQFVDDSGETRLAGTLAPDPNPAPVQTGSATPLNAVTPASVGELYVDTVHGAVYVAIGLTSADWVQLGGKGNTATPASGVTEYPQSGGQAIAVLAQKSVEISDLAGFANSGNGIYWLPGSGDGTQHAQIIVGTLGAFTHEFDFDGTYTNANGIKFPTADPHVAGAWWDNAGVLTKSAG